MFQSISSIRRVTEACQKTGTHALGGSFNWWEKKWAERTRRKQADYWSCAGQ